MDLHLGSTGDPVRRLEQRLRDLGLYTGPIDSVFGGGVESGVKSFQKANSLQPDGIVGARTWTALFPGAAPPVPLLLSQPIAQRCLALTGAFETSTGFPDCYCGLTGDFDGQGMSYGVLQWNIGQGTLQPLFSDMLAAHQGIIANIFHDNLDAITKMLASPRDEQLAFVRSIQDPNRHLVFEPWRGLFQALGRTPEFQAIQTNHAGRIHQNALDLCGRYGVNTERALALMFDICVQNGSISAATESIIRADFDAMPASSDPMVIEVARLQAIANRRAEAASPRFVEDVRTRKLTIANGQGVVHSIPYHLEEQFGIRLTPAAEVKVMRAP
jgi:hypothetical protein